jgi:hypothetical protein
MAFRYPRQPSVAAQAGQAAAAGTSRRLPASASGARSEASHPCLTRAGSTPLHRQPAGVQQPGQGGTGPTAFFSDPVLSGAGGGRSCKPSLMAGPGLHRRPGSAAQRLPAVSPSAIRLSSTPPRLQANSHDLAPNLKTRAVDVMATATMHGSHRRQPPDSGSCATLRSSAFS